jgi:hypothetical protein
VDARTGWIKKNGEMRWECFLVTRPIIMPPRFYWLWLCLLFSRNKLHYLYYQPSDNKKKKMPPAAFVVVVGHGRWRRTVAIAIMSVLVGISIVRECRRFHQEQYRTIQELQNWQWSTTAVIKPDPQIDSDNQKKKKLDWPITFSAADAATRALSSSATATADDQTPQHEKSRDDKNTSSLLSTSTTTTVSSHHNHNNTAKSILLDWEKQSAMPTRECVTPPDVPSYCCLGSISAGGAVFYNPNQCRLPVSDYDLSDYTSQFIPTMVSTSTSSMDHHQDSCDDVCAMVQMLSSHNLTLSFLGDSMTRQTFVGLECEIHKQYHTGTGYRVTVTTIPADRSNITHRVAKDQVAWRYGLTDTVTIRIASTTLTTDDHVPMNVEIKYYAMYRPFDDMEEVIHVFRTSDIVVFDFGLHFMPAYDMKKFQRVMRRMVDVSDKEKRNRRKRQKSATAADTQHRPHLLVWRETSAQHFNGTGGHYGPGVKDSATCVPVVDQLEGVRLPVLQQLTSIADITNWNSTDTILFIPYRNFTLGLLHLHNTDNLVGKDRGQDCSHFCHTPYVWQPIWYHLQLGMKKYVAQLQQLEQEQQKEQPPPPGADAS